MKQINVGHAAVITTITAGAMAVAAVGFAGTAVAAPTGPSDVSSTVSALKADGYNVVVNRTGHAPLSQCAVSAVRPGGEFSRTDSGHPGDALSTTVISKTVYVDLTC